MGEARKEEERRAESGRGRRPREGGEGKGFGIINIRELKEGKTGKAHGSF